VPDNRQTLSSGGRRRVLVSFLQLGLPKDLSAGIPPQSNGISERWPLPGYPVSYV
jgi:hypothetical protein